MEYTFRQIPKKSQNKILFFIIGAAVVSLVLAFVVMYLISPLDFSEGLKTTLFVVCFALPAGISIYWFTKKYAIEKTIRLFDDFIEVMENHPQKSSSSEVTDDDPTFRNYRLTPPMIKGFRYISGSDEANHFHVMTHDKNYEIIIPEKDNKVLPFKTVRDELEKWLRSHQVKEW